VVITTIDSTARVWGNAGKDFKFNAILETVAGRLPILRDTLQTCHEHFEPIKTSLPPDAAQSLVKTIDSCKGKAEKLGTIFQETIPCEDHQWCERYRKVTRRLGKGSRVEELMKAIIEDAQNLVNYHAIQSTNPEVCPKLEEIIKEMDSVQPSLSMDEADSQIVNNCGGTQNVSTGSSTQHNINQGSGTMNNSANIPGNPPFHLGKD